MPVSKKRKHGSNKPKRKKTFCYDPVYTDGLTPDLRHILKSKLTLPELVELEKQLRRAVEETAKRATLDTHKAAWAVTLRVLHDRFGFEAEQKKALYDASMEYLKDISDGILSLQDMFDTLENEDGICLTWEEDEG
ncbi:MAG: hypothetical protein IKV50_09165 [Clostridia bacterium]|nr:hypothetical protein [Clostridia bacterium]MBR5264846.1 hypothetical protein [Clostridia bacterium]